MLTTVLCVLGGVACLALTVYLVVAVVAIRAYVQVAKQIENKGD